MILILSWSSSGFKLALCSLGTHVLALYDFVPKTWAGGAQGKKHEKLKGRREHDTKTRSNKNERRRQKQDQLRMQKSGTNAKPRVYSLPYPFIGMYCHSVLLVDVERR